MRRRPEPWQAIPGRHVSDGGAPPWCLTCTRHYRAPIRFPCGTYRYQNERG